MTADASWYTVVESASLPPTALLEQGDVLPNCPRFHVSINGQWPLPEDEDVNIDQEDVRAVLLTQTCDLVHDKVEWVLLAVVYDWRDAEEAMVQQGNQSAKSRKYRENLVQGNIPSKSLLNQYEPHPALPWAVVDFQQLFVLPKTVVRHVAAAAGPRLRLQSPYKEHLAQAFARYFMRVGLPHDAAAFVSGYKP
jgi:hypothetical protein